jgi:hypothetical protein
MNCTLVGRIRDLPYMYTDLHVKMPVNYCQILMKLEFSRQIFEMYSDFFFLNPFSESRVVLPRRTVTKADVMKLIVSFRNFANAPKKCEEFEVKILVTKAS